MGLGKRNEASVNLRSLVCSYKDQLCVAAASSAPTAAHPFFDPDPKHSNRSKEETLNPYLEASNPKPKTTLCSGLGVVASSRDREGLEA